jgi:hypothetical protein
MSTKDHQYQLKLCPICLKKKLFTIKLGCCTDDYFCRFCLENSTISACPLCRQPIKNKEELLKLDKKSAIILEDFLKERHKSDYYSYFF